MGWGARLRALRMDVGPFREHRDFRLLLIAGTVFYLGGMMTYVAIPFQIYQLTHSNFAVGAVGLVELGPADRLRPVRRRPRRPRRPPAPPDLDRHRPGGVHRLAVHQRVLRHTRGCGRSSSSPDCSTSSSALQRPSREALLPRTVRHDELTAANALSSFGMQAGVLVGPTIGGLIVASAGVEWCFLVDIVGLFVASMMYAAMRRYPHVGETEAPSLAGIGKGLRYALSRRDLLGTYLVDLAAMLLAMPVVLFPALAEKVFGDPHLLGLLYSAETVGALVATALLGLDLPGAPPRPRHRAGRGGVRRRASRWRAWRPRSGWRCSSSRWRAPPT